MHATGPHTRVYCPACPDAERYTQAHPILLHVVYAVVEPVALLAACECPATPLAQSKASGGWQSASALLSAAALTPMPTSRQPLMDVMCGCALTLTVVAILGKALLVKPVLVKALPVAQQQRILVAARVCSWQWWVL